MIEDYGATLRLSGNCWKQIDLPYTITPDTILSFDFRSATEGEMHAIGFDDDAAFGGGVAFQLFGMDGWDWNRWPGTTTIHLPLDELRGDKSNARAFSDEAFVGGVSFRGQHGLFAMKLHDTVHNPTFRANKSVFCFDNRVICLGSDIRNDDAAHATETTLFQVHLPQGADAVPEVSESGLLRDPVGNWYYVPNDRGLRLTQGQQESINDSGKRATSDHFATAWLDHGPAPADSNYHYAIVLGADEPSMVQFAHSPPYRVLQQDGSAHIVRDASTGITGYSLFRPLTAPLDDDLLLATEAPCMLMIGPAVDGGERRISLCLPDLAFSEKRFSGIDDLRDEDVWNESQMQSTTVTLRGRWQLYQSYEGIEIIASSPRETQISLRDKDGMTREVDIRPIP